VSIRRDYKPTSTWQRRRLVVRRHGLLVITLVLIGLFGGLLAYIKGDRPQAPRTAATAPARPPSTPAAPAMPKPTLETTPAPVKPKYDFYTELPKRQIEIRREESRPKSAPPPPPARTQPAVEPLRKPATPKKNTTTPTVVTAANSGSKPVQSARPAYPSRPAQPPQSLATRSAIAVKTE